MTLKEIGTLENTKRLALDAIFKQAGEEMDFSKVTSIEGTVEEKMTKTQELSSEADVLTKQRVDLEALAVSRESNTSAQKGLNKVANGLDPVDGLAYGASETQHKIYTLPANVKKYSSLQNFKGENADVRAYRFGMWCLASAINHKSAIKYCNENGIPLQQTAEKTHQEGTESTGGALVPEEFGNDMIDLREQYGVFRRNTKIVPMSTDTRTDPRRTGGIEAYFEGESQAAVEAMKGWDRVSLIAKKLIALSKYSTELAEDAVLNIGDDLAFEIAYAFSKKEDRCGFVGDGTSTCGGIVGVFNALFNVYGAGGGVGLTLGSGNLWSELALLDFHAVVGILPEYADLNAKWYCSKTFWSTVMQKLVIAAGGTTAAEVMQGARNKSFLGYPVEVTQYAPRTQANSQVPCVFGDLRMGTSLGDRRQMVISFSNSALNAFENDEMVIKGTERIDINVHDVGNSTDPGPIVGLVTAAS